MVVMDELTKLGIHSAIVELGEVNIMENISAEQQELFKIALFKSGLELMDDKKGILIQKIKNTIIDLVHYSEEPLKINLSDFLCQKLHHEYNYLSNLFSAVQGITIERFYISHKIERVKELLVYNEFSLTEIAYMMHYCSVSHLSNQFKKTTGLTPSHFKGLKEKRRSMLEDL